MRALDVDEPLVRGHYVWRHVVPASRARTPPHDACRVRSSGLVYEGMHVKTRLCARADTTCRLPCASRRYAMLLAHGVDAFRGLNTCHEYPVLVLPQR